jgi:hypothetical protein
MPEHTVEFTVTKMFRSSPGASIASRVGRFIDRLQRLDCEVAVSGVDDAPVDGDAIDHIDAYLFDR